MASHGRPFDVFSVLPYSPRAWIELDIGNVQDLFRRNAPPFRGPGPSQNRTDARHKLPRVEWLRQIFISADLETYNTIDVLSASCEQQDRDSRLVANPA